MAGGFFTTEPLGKPRDYYLRLAMIFFARWWELQFSMCWATEPFGPYVDTGEGSAAFERMWWPKLLSQRTSLPRESGLELELPLTRGLGTSASRS